MLGHLRHSIGWNPSARRSEAESSARNDRKTSSSCFGAQRWMAVGRRLRCDRLWLAILTVSLVPGKLRPYQAQLLPSMRCQCVPQSFIPPSPFSIGLALLHTTIGQRSTASISPRKHTPIDHGLADHLFRCYRTISPRSQSAHDR